MSKLYWMDQVIAVTNASELTYSKNPIIINNYYPSPGPTNVNDALDILATKKTGIIMSQNISSTSTSVSFHNDNFTDDMYVDYYSSKELILDGFPTYDSSGKNITFTFKQPEEDCKLKIVAKY